MKMAKKEKFVLVSLQESKAKRIASVLQSDTCRKILDYLAEKNATETELAEKLDIPISTVHYNLKHLIESQLVEAEEFHYSEKGKEVNHYSLSNKYVVIAPRGITEGFKEKLKSLIPVSLLLAAGAGFIHLFTSRISHFGGSALSKSSGLVQGPVFETISQKISEGAAESAPAAMNVLAEEAARDAVVATRSVAASKAGDAIVTAAQPMLAEAQNEAMAASVEPLRDTATQVVTERVIHNQTIQLVTERIIDTAPSAPYWFWFLTGAASAIVLYILVDYIRTRRK